MKKGQKDKLRSTKHTHKTKDRVTRITLETGVNSTYIVNCHTIKYNKIGDTDISCLVIKLLIYVFITTYLV